MKQVLKNTPLSTGNTIAIAVTVFLVGLACGWVLNAERMYGYCMVP